MMVYKGQINDRPDTSTQQIIEKAYQYKMNSYCVSKKEMEIHSTKRNKISTNDYEGIKSIGGQTEIFPINKGVRLENALSTTEFNTTLRQINIEKSEQRNIKT